MNIVTNKGEHLNELIANERVLLVFLRHFGCTFCRETMSELANTRTELEASGVKIVIVHMVSTDVAEPILDLYDLTGISHISDEEKAVYNKYGLFKTGFRAMFGVKNWWRALVAGIIKGHLIGKPAGDPWQMPGVFLLQKQRILNKFTYRFVSDRPDFVKFARIRS